MPRSIAEKWRGDSDFSQTARNEALVMGFGDFRPGGGLAANRRDELADVKQREG